MKFTTLALTLLIATAVLADDKVTIDLYYESLCPGCQQYIVGTLKAAINTKDLDQICTISFFPYGNARQQQQGSDWVFTCQHGARECYGNLVETCAIATYDVATANQFIVCIEMNASDFDSRAKICASQLGVSATDLYTCINGDKGNQAQHAIADATDALQPAHQYTPWVVTNGNHTSQDEYAAESNTVKYCCDHYKGSVKIDACKNQKMMELFGAPIENKCYRNTVEEQLNITFEQ